MLLKTIINMKSCGYFSYETPVSLVFDTGRCKTISGNVKMTSLKHLEDFNRA